MYGREAVSQIITFGTMAAKAVVRDVGRCWATPTVSSIASPNWSRRSGHDPGQGVRSRAQAAGAHEQDEEVKASSTWRRRLEGVTQRRQTCRWRGDRATKITDFAPLLRRRGQNPVTQFDKNDVEYAGLVKFDFLGLRTLTIIDWALA